MQNTTIKIKKSYIFGVLTFLFWIPLPLLYINPPQFLLGQPLAVYAIVLFLAGMTCAALALSFVLKSRMSARATKIYSLLFLLAGIGIYQFSGLAPNWSCFGKQIYVATANAAGQNCTTTCTNNKTKPCSGWSTCWDKFVSCDASGKDQDGRPCGGCCFSCTVVCEAPPPSDSPPTITSDISCSQGGDNGWCIGTGILTLTASDPQGYSLTISGDIGETPFTCEMGNTCFQPLPQGNGKINYTVNAEQSGMSKSGSTSWKLDITPPSVNGTLSGTAGSKGWYLGSVTYNGSASDSISGLASFTCTLDGTALGSCNSITVNDEGTHTLIFTASDKAGNEQTFNQKVLIDIQNPVLTASMSGTLGSNNWYNAATLNASASDPLPGSGLSALDYNLDNSGWTTFPVSGALDLPEGKHDVDIRAMDTAGRVVTSTKSYWLDGNIPGVALDPSGTTGSNNWYTTNLTLAASANDDMSGMDIFEYSLNSTDWTTYSTPLTLNDGSHNLSFWAQDLAGLVTQVDETYNVDKRVPQIAGSLSGVPGTNGWFISDVTISTSAVDPVPGSGLEALTYILNGSSSTPYTNPIILTDGLHNIQFDAQDYAGLNDKMTQTVKVDTTAPLLNIETTFSNWSKSTITLNGTSSDNGSGLSKVEISNDNDSTWQTVNGTTSWSYDWNTTTTTSGLHQVHVRSTDNAGLTTEQIINAGVDNNAPKISLLESWFQWDTVTLDVWDNDSGLSKVRVEISDPEGRWKARKMDLDLSSFPLEFKWDRRFGDNTVAPLGTYKVKVVAYDNMGNLKEKDATIKILLGILPAGPTATPQPYVRANSTPTPASTPVPYSTPTAVSTPVTNTFGSTSNLAQQAEVIPAPPAAPRAAPTKTNVLDWLESIFVPTTTEETVTQVSTPETNPKVFWGATLAAMFAAVTAYGISEKRKREEEAARKAQAGKPLSDFKQKIRARKTAAMKTKEAQLREIAQIDLQKQAILEVEMQQKKFARMERKEAIVEAEMKSYSAKPQEWEAGYNAYMAKKAMEDYRAGEKAEYVVTPKEKSWWEKSIDWVDNHQAEVALGIGVAVGIGAIILSAGTATPLVAAWVAGAAIAAGGTVALGTIGLNKYYERDWKENVGRNLAISAVTAGIITGAALFLTGPSLIKIGNGLAGYCVTHPSVCSRADVVLNAFDKLEEVGLMAKGGVQTLTGNSQGAAETALELQMEYLDGGVPGNSLAKEFGDQLAKLGPDSLEVVQKYGDDIVPFLLKYGNDATDIIGAYGDEGIALFLKFGDQADEVVSLIKNHGDSAVKLLNLNTVNLASAQKLLKTLDNDVLDYAITQGPDAVAALSRWSDDELLKYGPELAIRAQKDAKVLQDIKKLTSLKPIDSKRLTSEQRDLINAIAENSMQYSDEGQIVLGKWVDYGNGFTNYARETGSVHYNPHPDMWNLLGDLGDNREEAAWLVNKQVIQNGIDKGLPFEYTLQGVPIKDIPQEKDVVELIFEGETDIEIMKELDISYISIRWKELRELKNTGYELVFDEVNNSFVLSPP